jgi:hypothetical protein
MVLYAMEQKCLSEIKFLAVLNPILSLKDT